MPYKKITGLVPATAITDDDLLVVVDSPASGAATRKITWAQILAYFASATNTLTLGNAGLHLLDTDASHDLIVSPGSNLTADRTLTVATGDADRTLTLGGDVAFAGAFATSGGHAVTLATTGATAITLPTSGTLATTSDKLSAFAATTSAELAGVISDETGSGALVFATSPTLVTPTLGVATATSINKVAITAPAVGSTLTIQNGFTLLVSGNATVNQDLSSTASPTFAGLTVGAIVSSSSGAVYALSKSEDDSILRMLRSYVFSDATGRYASFDHYRARGTSASPTVASGANYIVSHQAWAMDAGGSYRACAFLSAQTESGAGASGVPGRWNFVTTNASNATTYTIIDSGGNVGVGCGVNEAFPTGMTRGVFVKSGNAPSSSPADAFSMYSADQAAGNACPTFRTENGTVIVLNQSLSTMSSPVFAGVSLMDAQGTFSTKQNNVLEVYLEKTGLRLRNILASGGWARSLTGYEDSAGTSYFALGARGSGQSTTYAFLGPAYNNAWVKIDTNGNLAFGMPNETIAGSSATKTFVFGSGTAPTTSPVDAFQMYSADQAAGNACPHIRTENGGIVKLYQQAAIADAAGGDEVSKINAILGVLRNAGLIAT